MLPDKILQDDRPIEALTTSELAQHIVVETDRFLRQKTSNEAYGRELFRRALTDGDNAAWGYVYQQFSPLVLSWIGQHRGVISLLTNDDADALIQASFAKFWQSLSKPGKMEHFDSLASLLKYLKMTVHSIVTDAVRAQQARHNEETLDLLDGEGEPRTEKTPEDAVMSAVAAHDLWQTIQAEVSSEDERLLLYLTYVQDMQPREICSAHRRRFPTVDDVYRVKRNVLERLRRSQRIKKMLHAA